MMYTQDTDVVKQLTDIVISARTGDYSTLSSQLNQVLQLIQHDLSGGTVETSNLKKMLYSLETLNAMQQLQNWVAFADVLEYEFIPLWVSLHR